MVTYICSRKKWHSPVAADGCRFPRCGAPAIAVDVPDPVPDPVVPPVQAPLPEPPVTQTIAEPVAVAPDIPATEPPLPAPDSPVQPVVTQAAHGPPPDPVEPVTEPVSTAVATPVVQRTPPGRRRLAVYAGLAVLVFAGGGIGVWSMRRTRPASLSRLPVDQFLLRVNDPARIKAEADRRWQANRREESVLLLEEAARRGNAAADAELARDYDPSEPAATPPGLPPDARAAARYYQEAAHRGADVATARERLRTSLAAKTAAGDVLSRPDAEGFLAMSQPQ